MIGKCMRGGSPFNDATVSPVVRQTLLHWAYQLNEVDYIKGAARVQTHGAAYMPKSQLTHVMTAAATSKAGSKKKKKKTKGAAASWA